MHYGFADGPLRTAHGKRASRAERGDDAPVAARLGPPGIWLLTTRGRRTGKPHTTPVSLVEDEAGRYLVAPYGTSAWVFNARAAGSVTVRRGRRSQTLPITELGAAESAPVLQRYVRRERVVRPWFDAPHDGPVEAFAAEADRHPVFRLG